jgi:hypothetical protein
MEVTGPSLVLLALCPLQDFAKKHFSLVFGADDSILNLESPTLSVFFNGPEVLS